ncbi:ECF transporter S component [Clostridium sp. SYSU_GA19001]|uniref:ECF transporter S component n=1 Tax=Clostridium caldaquaticum TaxID=2940653 RepID=UPI0020774E42|nr:ECF transporter S component [Clostridium caldaquaticum]MCM8710056.1 ECF transporter S component [Clostridium caldaquaticum]
MKTRKLSITALFIALSLIGANIKIAGSIAFDSMPGFLGALTLGPVFGALIGAIGHLLTAATSGFPLSLPVHLIVMINMALTMYMFGVIYKVLSKVNKYAALIVSNLVGVVINGPVSLFMIIPILGSGVMTMLPILTLIAFLNILIADIVYKLLPESVKLWKSEKSEI